MSTPGTPSGRVVTWAARLVWLAVALLGGAAFGSALESFDRPVQLTGTIGVWTGWAAVALALMVPSTVGLTTVRMIVPAGLVAGAVAAIAADSATQAVACIAPLVVMCLLVASGELGEHFAQASAYGDELRFPLRPPVAFLAPTVVSWIALCAMTISGPLLLAGGVWLAGAPMTLAAVALVWLLPRRYHRLARRWLVLVPAGLVIHDQVVLAETAMFLRQDVAGVRLAYADTEAADLTGPAAGHAIELELREMATVVLAGTRDKPGGTALHVRSMLVAPTRPGRALRSAADRRLPVG